MWRRALCGSKAGGGSNVRRNDLSGAFCTHISARAFLSLRRAECLAIEPRRVEATNPLLSRCEHFAGIIDPFLAGLGLFGRNDPMNPIDSRDRGRCIPCSLGLRCRLQGFGKICRHLGLPLMIQCCNLELNLSADLRLRRSKLGIIDSKPMALATIWLKQCFKLVAVHRHRDGGSTPSLQLRACFLGEHNESPRTAAPGLLRAQRPSCEL